ncbi:MAG: hypothetical protein U0X75_12885 [Acidobacteriota bacterium]
MTSEKVELIANRPQYNPGETAEILVQAPLPEPKAFPDIAP